MEDPRFRVYLVFCEWVKEMFEPYYGDKCRLWFAGIDVERIADTRGCTSRHLNGTQGVGSLTVAKTLIRPLP